ncbi:hypothetical protein [Pedobacter alpinus]|uniref:Lipoprotein n=1 Tax=Pedobacter alpinus TaxID=1590643 RepID=A0ABW5TQ83_9SPHI
MDKIIFFLIVVILLSCKSKIKVDEAIKGLKIEYNAFITYDFNTNSIYVEIDSFKYIDSLILTDEDLNKLSKSFNESKISKIKGERWYSDNNMSFPADVIVLKFYYENKIRSEVIISRKMKLKSSIDSDRIVLFKDLLLDIFQRNEKIQKALEISYKKQEETNNILY